MTLMVHATNIYRICILLLPCLCCLASWAQQVKLSLLVTDPLGLAVDNATININHKKSRTDSAGRAFILSPPGDCYVAVSAVGHSTTSIRCVLSRDTSFTIILQVRESLLGNVTVNASRNVQLNQMSTQAIGIDQIKKLPVILGETDPLKTITLLPGVKSGGDAGAGIYVRGGGPDQNLVLLDGVPVYNPNHLLGFFSVFNGDAVKGVEVIKGGMPAEYGGRLSSVINVSTRDGRADSLKGTGGIGLISSRVSLEGPLKKGKSSFMISGRRTYIDQVAAIVAKKRIGGNGYFFYDLNAKADYQLNSNHQLYLTFYKGKDEFSFHNEEEPGRERDFNANWGNTIVGLTWKQKINRNLQQELTLVYNNFALTSRIAFSTRAFTFASGLRDYQLKNGWVFQPVEWLKWKWGLQYIAHRFKPGAGSSTAGEQAFNTPINDQYAREAAAYISADINITPRLNLIAGLRYSYFNQVGPSERVIYGDDGAPTGQLEVYGKGESIAKYHYPEPRINLLYKLPGQASLKASYTRTLQYLHLATTSAATFPSDLWVPAGKLIKPGIAQQVAAGYFRDINDGTWEMSAEAYYKTMSNQLEFSPGAELLLNQNLEGEMIFGSGKAYGLELFAKKKKGRLTGWIGYTLSRAERTFARLNNGKPYPYRYDRTHDLSIVASYPLNKKWELSAVFIYGTGNALTLPAGRFAYFTGFNGEEQRPLFTNINQYGKINDYRMPAYHRMDIAFTYTPHPETKRRFKGNWVFSLHNLYNRYNPYFIYLDVDEGQQTIIGKKVFLFPLIPGVTWNFKF